MPPLEGQTPAERAAAALAAAQAAAAAAAAAVAAADPSAVASSRGLLSQSELDSSTEDDYIDVEAGLATDAIPGSREEAFLNEDSSSSSSDSDAPASSDWPQSAPWWNQAMQMVPGVPESHDWAADAVADADGSAAMLIRGKRNSGDSGAGAGDGGNSENEEGGTQGVVPLAWLNGKYSEGGSGLVPTDRPGEEDSIVEGSGTARNSAGNSVSSSGGDGDGSSGDGGVYTRGGPLGDIIISSDIPIEEIAAEVQKSWKLRDRHVETLLQKAVENRVRRSEKPWLMLTAIMGTSSAILLSIVLYRLYTGQ